MTIIVTCACGRLVECSGSEGGHWIRCPACGRELEIPRIGPPAAGREPSVDRRPPLMAPASAPTPVPAPTNAKAIASLGLGLIFFLGCLSGLPAIVMGIKALRELRESKRPARGRGLAIAGIALGVFNCLLTVAFMMPAVRSSREAARRAQCTNNIKQIGLAMHNYLEDNGCLPPAAITDKNGRPLLSWRVLILPYLEQRQLFTQFRLDEPWDSPHNRALLERTPSVYQCPSDRELPPGMTGYQVVVGPDTPFPPDGRPVKIGEITDGASNTLLVGESRHVVPWTKPEDQSPGTILLPDRGLGSHHGYHNNGFNALFVDGSVLFLRSTIDRGVLEALTTRNGNETIQRDQY